MYILYKGVQNTITNPNAANTHTIYRTLLRHIMHQPLTKHCQYTKSCNTPTLPKNIQYTNLSSNTTNAHTPTSHQTLPMHIHQPLIKHYQYTNLSSNTTHTPTTPQTLPMHIHQPLVKHYRYANLPTLPMHIQITIHQPHQTLPIHQPLTKRYQYTYRTPTSHLTLPIRIQYY